MTLDKATLGNTYRIQAIGGSSADQRHLNTLGLVEGCAASHILRAPSGDPMAFLVHGSVIALRKDQLKTVTATLLDGDCSEQ